MGNQLPNYANNKSHEELLHELCKMYKHTAEVYQDPASYYKLGTIINVSYIILRLYHIDIILFINHAYMDATYAYISMYI